MRRDRSFLGSTASDRKNSINENLHRVDLENLGKSLRGKVIVCIDDSTIRGNNSKRERDLLIESGVKKIYHLNYTPEVGIIGEDSIARGCIYGVDMPPEDKFIARTKGKHPRNRTIEEISKEMKMNVAYISLEGMLKGYGIVGIPRNHLCYYCIGGPKPF